jgi:hypothetical protein
MEKGWVEFFERLGLCWVWQVITRLKEVYRRHILPLEMKYQFNKFG